MSVERNRNTEARRELRAAMKEWRSMTSKQRAYIIRDVSNPAGGFPTTVRLLKALNATVTT